MEIKLIEQIPKMKPTTQNYKICEIEKNIKTELFLIKSIKDHVPPFN